MSLCSQSQYPIWLKDKNKYSFIMLLVYLLNIYSLGNLIYI